MWVIFLPPLKVKIQFYHPHRLCHPLTTLKLSTFIGNQIATSEDFVEAMKVLPRPMTITLYRYVPGGAGASSSGSRSTVPALDDTEKEKRREAMVAAALQREKSWDKKVASAKDKRGTQTDHTGRPIYDHR